MKKGFIAMPVLLTGLILGLMTACASTGENNAEQAAQGVDVFASKNWNAPSHNNMYDRWEFNADGTFHFWHIHHGEPIDRGVYRYELKDGVITIAKEGDTAHWHYAYVFSSSAVTLTPLEYDASEHAPSSSLQMGALPDAPVTFTHAR